MKLCHTCADPIPAGRSNRECARCVARAGWMPGDDIPKGLTLTEARALVRKINATAALWHGPALRPAELRWSV